jgi:hypothetical protein
LGTKSILFEFLILPFKWAPLAPFIELIHGSK